MGLKKDYVSVCMHFTMKLTGASDMASKPAMQCMITLVPQGRTSEMLGQHSADKA
jgi:hypothetical protein